MQIRFHGVRPVRSGACSTDYADYTDLKRSWNGEVLSKDWHLIGMIGRARLQDAARECPLRPHRSERRQPRRGERVSGLQRTSLSLAAFVLICFFLPWVQLSCVGMKD